jgi:hypothetical protein
LKAEDPLEKERRQENERYVEKQNQVFESFGVGDKRTIVLPLLLPVGSRSRLSHQAN